MKGWYRRSLSYGNNRMKRLFLKWCCIGLGRRCKDCARLLSSGFCILESLVELV